MLRLFEIGSIGTERGEVVHAFIKARVSSDLDHVCGWVVPQDIFPGLGVSKKDTLADVRSEF
jgi:hypothetical protein